MSNIIIDVTLENGEVAFESSDPELLKVDTVTLENGAVYYVGDIEEEFDDFYNCTRYTMFVY